MAINCHDIYDSTYKAFISRGYTPAEAADAAREAYSACLQRAGTVVAPTIATASGRISDKGPVRERAQQIDYRDGE